MTHDAPLFTLYRRGDPATSRQAAATAPRRTHERMVLEAIRQRPGSNAYEIAAATGLNHVQVDRRGQRDGASCLWPNGSTA